MALEGQLSDFNLAEILQLLASQQKSGFLNLETTRQVVFIFDKGVLISTRDRRSRSRDPLESFLRAYGFFTEQQWKHVEYVSKNSSLDLSEILISESMLSEAELDSALKSLAQEMIFAGMKMRRGRYHFSPTKDTPPGVKWRYNLDVQGLLMESARRLDEESLLKELLPSQAITFSQGNKIMPAEGLSDTGKRIMEMALAGLPLGRIIRQGHTESFVVRNLLKIWIDEGILKKHDPTGDEDEDDSSSNSIKMNLSSGLRSLPLTIVALLLVGALGWFRWTAAPEANYHAGRDLREAQLRSEVITAARLFRYQKGEWPDSLGELVRAGQLAPSVKMTSENLGWQYKLNRKRDTFTFGT
ncbi:MAG: hypothetical protein ACI9UK_000554 [Candidatus Krumholzibacteriia bacterium]|jgi:uncharacterized protein YihD (DUF1040 family)